MKELIILGVAVLAIVALTLPALLSGHTRDQEEEKRP